MTYNFDPERWYERERAALDARRAGGELDEVAYQAAIERLESRYDAMTERLDKPFDLPGTDPSGTGPGSGGG